MSYLLLAAAFVCMLFGPGWIAVLLVLAATTIALWDYLDPASTDDTLEYDWPPPREPTTPDPGVPEKRAKR